MADGVYSSGPYANGMGITRPDIEQAILRTMFFVDIAKTVVA